MKGYLGLFMIEIWIRIAKSQEDDLLFMTWKVSPDDCCVDSPVYRLRSQISENYHNLKNNNTNKILIFKIIVNNKIIKRKSKCADFIRCVERKIRVKGNAEVVAFVSNWSPIHSHN